MIVYDIVQKIVATSKKTRQGLKLSAIGSGPLKGNMVATSKKTRQGLKLIWSNAGKNERPLGCNEQENPTGIET